MTAPDIRAQAIEAIARRLYEDATPGSALFATWKESKLVAREAFLWQAEEVVRS